MRRPGGWLLALAVLATALVGYQLRRIGEDPVVPPSDSILCQRDSECHPDIVYGTDAWGQPIVSYPARYCAKADGDCPASGHCEWVPRVVLDVLAPVCGCDEKTYGNSSVAYALGVNVAHEGECLGQPYRRPSGPDVQVDRVRAATVLHAAAERAGKECARPDGPRVGGVVRVTFDGGGRAISVQLSGPLAMDPAAECAKRRFKAVRLDPFEGDTVTIAVALSLPGP